MVETSVKAFLLDKIEISPPSWLWRVFYVYHLLPYQTMEYLRLHALKRDERQIFALYRRPEELNRAVCQNLLRFLCVADTPVICAL